MTSSARVLSLALVPALLGLQGAGSPAEAGFLGRLVSKTLGRTASRTATTAVATTAGRTATAAVTTSATRTAGRSVTRGLFRRGATRALTGVRAAGTRLAGLNPLRRIRMGRYAGSTLGGKGAGVRQVQKVAAGSLRSGEKIAGVHHAWYRTSSGRVLRVKPNKFQPNVWQAAQGKLAGAEKIVGVESAGFLTSTGRVLHATPGSVGSRLATRLRPIANWGRFIAYPAAAGFVWTLVDRVTLMTAASKVKEKTDQLTGTPPPDEKSGDGILGQGDATVIQIDQGPDGASDGTSDGTRDDTQVVVIRPDGEGGVDQDGDGKPDDTGPDVDIETEQDGTVHVRVGGSQDSAATQQGDE